ncbi:uncharacterized protein LOC109616014 [Esox lucius]|uniref:uncharacterized protein LOC109616014 n=1 Tax=Esox lucius TaxID=8010 RepID=UPI0014774EA2|nr:uncharacterized protein LOC109616014 [Esox lucius]
MGQAQSPNVSKRQPEHIQEGVKAQKKKKTHLITAAFQYLFMLSCCGVSCNEKEDYSSNTENLSENHSSVRSSFYSGKLRSSLDREKPPAWSSRTRTLNHDYEESTKQSFQSKGSKTSKRSKKQQRALDPERNRQSNGKNGGSTRSRTSGGSKTSVKKISITQELPPNWPSFRTPSNTSSCSIESLSSQVHTKPPQVPQASASNSSQCSQSFSSQSSLGNRTGSPDSQMDWQLLPGVPSLSFPEEKRDKTPVGSTFDRQLMTTVAAELSREYISDESKPSPSTSGLSHLGRELSNPDLNSLGTVISVEEKTPDEENQSDISYYCSASVNLTQSDATEYKDDQSPSSFISEFHDWGEYISDEGTLSPSTSGLSYLGSELSNPDLNSLGTVISVEEETPDEENQSDISYYRSASTNLSQSDTDEYKNDQSPSRFISEFQDWCQRLDEIEKEISCCLMEYADDQRNN